MSSTAANRNPGVALESLLDCPACSSGSHSPANLRWLDRYISRHLLSRLSRIDDGKITFDDGRVVHQLGSGADDCLVADWRVCDRRFYRKLARGSELTLAESYFGGYWSSSDLTSLLRILYRNAGELGGGPKGPFSAHRWWAMLARWLARNTVRGSRRNIAAHYDLGNDFFQLFLDSTLTYSAGYYESESATLQQASIAKLDRLCQKLKLDSTDALVEIGSGWGSFAVHAATHYGSRVTTTTISQNQFDYTSARVSTFGLDDRVAVQKRDYRELSGRFDKLVSIEMVEAVGEQFIDSYFHKCGELLRPGGRMAIQAIVMPEQRFEAYRKSIDFIQRYVFPGGFLPTVSGLCRAAGKNANLNLISVEDISTHYARTLMDWRERFLSRWDLARRLGLDDAFLRLWEYYLCYCEAAFREHAVQVVQIVWDKPKR